MSNMLVTLLAVPSLVCNLQERANDDDDDSVAEISESTDTDEAAKAGGCLWPNVRLSIHSCWCRIHPSIQCPSFDLVIVKFARY